MSSPTPSTKDLFRQDDVERKPTAPESAWEVAVSTLAKKHRLKALCLFSSAGIGELGIEKCGISIACANELVPYRVALYKENFPSHDIIAGDIWQLREEIVGAINRQLDGDELFLVYATPPCQGMSSNGLGRLKWEVTQGNRDLEDPRNRLIIPTVDLLVRLRPRWILLENVPGMQNTPIRDENNKLVNAISYIKDQLGEEYVGTAEVIACEDYGVPQKRKRLVTIFSRDKAAKDRFKTNGASFFSRDMREPRKTLRDAIGHLPPLDAVDGKNARADYHPYHYVNVLSEEKYWWVSNTPEGATAFSNQCVNPECGFQGNRTHRDEIVDGKWVASKTTPIHCEKCGSLLPRPVVREKDGSLRLLKGFHSAYRRMRYDEPSRTLTQNFIYEASDNKIHPDQNRVLSVLEALIIQTIDRYGYSFTIDGKGIGTAKIAEVIGESVPPYLIEKICSMMVRTSYAGRREQEHDDRETPADRRPDQRQRKREAS
jgi:DNA (cytosine-5)-methyltransferase 1